jgi:hypothetical protein
VGHPSNQRVGLTIARVHLRRALLLFALVLGLTALATSIAPPPSRDDSPATPPPNTKPVAAPTEITLHAPPTAAARSFLVGRDAHIVLSVVAAEGGQVEIPKLGQVMSVGEDATAEFDLLDLAAGRYDVLFEPALGAPVRLGTLVSR